MLAAVAWVPACAADEPDFRFELRFDRPVATHVIVNGASDPEEVVFDFPDYTSALELRLSVALQSISVRRTLEISPGSCESRALRPGDSFGDMVLERLSFTIVERPLHMAVGSFECRGTELILVTTP